MPARSIEQFSNARRGRVRALGGVARQPGRRPLAPAHRDAAPPRLQAARRPDRAGEARLAGPELGRARDRRHHPPLHVEHRRPARGRVRVRRDEGRAVGERRHRHLGRPPLAGHRLRDGPPQDRRHRRRHRWAPGASPRAAWAASRRRCATRPSRSARRAHRGATSSASSCATARPAAWPCARRGDPGRRRDRGHPPEDHVPRPARRARTCPTVRRRPRAGGRAAAAPSR